MSVSVLADTTVCTQQEWAFAEIGRLVTFNLALTSILSIDVHVHLKVIILTNREVVAQQYNVVSYTSVI